MQYYITSEYFVTVIGCMILEQLFNIIRVSAHIPFNIENEKYKSLEQLFYQLQENDQIAYTYISQYITRYINARVNKLNTELFSIQTC